MYRLLILALLLTGCSQSQQKNEPTEERSEFHANRLKENIGTNIYNILTHPDSVIGHIHGEETRSVKLFNDKISQLQSLLLNDSHYLFDIRKKIMFLPTYDFVFYRGNDSVTVTFSIPSSQVMFEAADGPLILDNDPAKDAFKTFVKSLNK